MHTLKKRCAVALAAALLTLGANGVQAATRYVNPDGVCGGNSPCYTTIQAAINAAVAGDTIEVSDGFYDESVDINKSLTLNGAQHGVDARNRSGAESVINHACSPVRIEADNVTLDGFTVQGSTQADPCTIAGIWMNPGFSGTQGGAQILNNIVQNNVSGIEFDNTGTIPAKVQFNLIRNNNNTGPGSGNGIQTNFGLTNATIDKNAFVGQTNTSILFVAPVSSVAISNNTLDTGIAMYISTGISITGNTSIGNTVSGTIYLGGGDSNVTISSNVLNNGVEAIVIENAFGSNSNVTISPNNCIAGNSVNGLRVSHLGYAGAAHSLSAVNNWWGAASGPSYNGAGPGTGDKITDPDGVVNFSPFLTSKTGTPCAPPPIGPPTSANQCKNDGWKTFNNPRTFKNQGDCIQYVNTGK
jgi:Right handed beta helix region